MKKTVDLKNWCFRIEKLDFEEQVTLPHTWNVSDNKDVQLYRGTGEYTTKISVDKIDFDNAVLYFGCAFHTANVYVNDCPAFIHTGCGYTPFEFDISKFLTVGENTIRVTVNNLNKPEMLPHCLDYDWADDGGLIRDVKLTFINTEDIYDIALSYDVEIIDGICSGKLNISIDSIPQTALIEVVEYKTNKTVISKSAFIDKAVSVDIDGLKAWDINSPNLYVIKVNGAQKRIGFRTIEVKGADVLLNGKRLFMKGCEWMPGSHPDYGMAEPLQHSIMRLNQLKDAGCVFTRFHWQQDSSVFDWCDENGLLVQEEIPYWGYPKKASPLQLSVAKKQAQEMVYYHSHHPSIICWGVGNELGGEFEETISYVKQMYSYFKSLDNSRLVNYVSNSVCRDTNVELDDATMYGDIAMWNEYLGLWQPCDDIENVIKRTYNKFGNMPSMVTEFGLCESAFKGGDPRRTEILLQRVPIYKQLKNMCGYVWFSLNDYRTHCGEEGEGKLKRRVHGSTGLKGEKKPSYVLFSAID